jgi:hypothetical protein
MTGLRSQRSMKRGFIPTSFCSELQLFSREAIAQVCAVCSAPKVQFVLRRGGFERNCDLSPSDQARTAITMELDFLTVGSQKVSAR